jgi:hypothetical protein
MDQRIRWVENEVIALSGSLQAIQALLAGWKQNDERGLSPLMPADSIRTMRHSMNGMRDNLNDLGDILDRVEAEDILDRYDE